MMATRVAKQQAAAETAAELTAAQRLAIARDGLARLRAEREAVRERKQAAQTVMDELTGKLRTLQYEYDVLGADVGPALASVREQCAEAARQVSIASAEALEFGDRMAAVNAALPALEAAAWQDELADAVAVGAGAADRYRTQLEAFLASSIELQAALTRCDVLADAIARKGSEPRHKLTAHLVSGQDIGHVLTVARNTGGDLTHVRRVTAALFERWRI